MRVTRFLVILAGVCAIAVPAMAQSPRDSVFCYAVKPTKDFDRFGKTVDTKKFFVRVDDIIDPSNPQGLVPGEVPGVDFTFQASKTRELCVPADVNAHGVSDPDTNWVSYQIKQQKGSCDGDVAVTCKKDTDCSDAGAGSLCTLTKELVPAKFDKKDPANLSVRVVDAFSDLRVDFAKELTLLTPASVDALGFQGVPSGEEQFKCYAIKPTKKVCTTDSPTNQLAACKSEEDCGGVKRVTTFCAAQPKFPKETHPGGLSASIETAYQGLLDPVDPPKTFLLSKLRAFCQSTETKLAGNPASLVNEPQAGMLCYQAKLAGAKCDAAAPVNALGACKKEEDCGGERKVTTFCQKKADPKFDKKSPQVLAQYVEDEIFAHRFDVAKEAMLCTPACRAAGDFELNDLVSHITHLALGPVGAPAALSGLPRGVNVDADLGTWAPGDQDPTGGIDNQLQPLGGLLNGLLQEQLDTGGFSLLFQADQLANGATTISGFTGELDSFAGCSVGVAPAPLDPGNPADPCNYTASASSFTHDVTGDCRAQALITLDVDVTGADTTPSASAVGGGPGNSFTLNVPLGDSSFAVTAENVRVEAEFTHDGSDISQIRGVLGGGVNHAALVAAVATLPDSCTGGANDGNACASGADCPGGTCELLAGFQAADLAGFIGGAFPPDLDLDGDMTNESVSIGLLFRATKAIATGIE